MSYRLTTLFFGPILGLIAFSWMAAPAGAIEIPFGTEQTIDSNFDRPEWLIATDIDADGDLDVLAGGQEEDAIRLWINDGSGTSWTPVTVASGLNGVRRVDTADIDGDGDLDAIGHEQVGGRLTWYENTLGDGTAWTEHQIGGLGQGYAVEAVDMDGDGDADVLTGGTTLDTIRWWENTAGDGSAWSVHLLPNSVDGVFGVHGADVDGDGDVDIVGTGSASDQVVWWENTVGDGSAWATHEISASVDGAWTPKTGDLDGDGDLDVLASALDGDAFTWWENTGACAGTGGACDTWIEHPFAGTFDGAQGVEVDDLDGDGDLDVLATTRLDDEILWLENTSGDGSTWTERNLDMAFNGASAVIVADLDGDGDGDVVASAADGDEVSWWQNQTLHRSATYPMKSLVASGLDDASSVFPADMDGDGDPDLVAALSTDDDIVWFENTMGDGSAWTSHPVAAGFDGAVTVHAADMDGDGSLDVLGAGLGENQIRLWRNVSGDGSSFSEVTVATGLTVASSVFAADFDGDGDLDAIGTALVSSQVLWFENVHGDGTVWTTHTIDGSFGASFFASAGDVDGDGDMDAIVAGSTAEEVVWFENTVGDGSAWSRHSAAGGLDEPRAITGADVDGDGDLDLVATDVVLDIVAWLENTAGDGSSWSTHLLGTSFAAAALAGVADLDGDGDLDIFANAENGNEVAWWENDSSSCDPDCAWPKHVVDSSFAGAFGVAAADLDRDGRLDLVATALHAGEVAWWSNQGGQFALPTEDAITDAAPMDGEPNVTMLEIAAAHRGRAGDDDLELTALELLFESSAGVPMGPGALIDIVDAVKIYLDDGDGVFESDGSDTVVYADGPGSVTELGLLTATFSDGDPNVLVSATESRTYFVTVDLAAAASQATTSSLRITHLTESSSSATMASTNLPLSLEFAADVVSSTLMIQGRPLIAVSPSAVAFGPQPVLAGPSTPRTVTISSHGTADVTITAISLSGDDAGEFAITEDSGETTLAPGESRTLSITFAPSSEGSKSAMLVVESNEPSVDVALSGSGYDPLDLLFIDGFESGDVSAWSAATGP